MKIRPGFVYFFGSLGGLLFGIDSGIISGAMTPIRQMLHLDAGQIGVMISAVLWGSAIAALLVGRLSDLYGRKKLLVAAAFIFIIGAAACFFVTGYMALLLWRVLLGGGIGIASAIVPAYLSELAPAAKRGTIATLFQFMIVAGLFSAYIIDYFLITDEQILFYAKKHGVTIFQGSLTNWQEMLGSAAIPAIILLIGVLIIPESPRFLVKIGKDEEARAVLMNLRGNDAKIVDAELEEIELVAHIPSEGFGKLLKVAKPALIAACGLAILQQFVGINAAFYYGPVIGESVLHSTARPGSPEALQHGEMFAIVFGAVNIIATFIAVLIMDKFKNKTLLYSGAGIMGVFALVLALINTGAIKHLLHLPGWLQITFVCAYIIGFAFSWGPIIWNTIGEIFPLSVRGVGAAVGSFSNWVANALIMTIFPVLVQQDANGNAAHIEYGFYVFAIFCVISILFVKFFVPETKGKSLKEIEEQLRGVTHDELVKLEK